MQGSIVWFLQIAQLSTGISQDHRATPFHFLTWNIFSEGAPPAAATGLAPEVESI